MPACGVFAVSDAALYLFPYIVHVAPPQFQVALKTEKAPERGACIVPVLRQFCQSDYMNLRVVMFNSPGIRERQLTLMSLEFHRLARLAYGLKRRVTKVIFFPSRLEPRQKETTGTRQNKNAEKQKQRES